MSATIPMTVGTVVIVGFGKVVTESQFEVKTFVAGGILAFSLSVLENVDTRLAELFAGAVLLTACYTYLPAIVDKLALDKPGPKK